MVMVKTVMASGGDVVDDDDCGDHYDDNDNDDDDDGNGGGGGDDDDGKDKLKFSKKIFLTMIELTQLNPTIFRKRILQQNLASNNTLHCIEIGHYRLQRE